jgi:hypothetical protein
MQLETEIGAWALDEACLVTGRKFENMFNEGKNPFADIQMGKGIQAQSYAPAPKRKIKTVKINANGTW